MVGALPRELLDKIKADGKKRSCCFGIWTVCMAFDFSQKKCYIHSMIYLHNICCNTRNCIALDPNILLHDLTGFVSMEHYHSAAPSFAQK